MTKDVQNTENPCNLQGTSQRRGNVMFYGCASISRGGGSRPDSFPYPICLLFSQPLGWLVIIHGVEWRDLGMDLL